MSTLRKLWGIAFLLLALAASAELAPAVQTAVLAGAPLESQLSRLADRVQSLEDQSRNQGLLGLLNQVEALKTEVAKLRGMQEEMAHHLQMADKRQKDVLAEFDAQLKEIRELASRPAPVVAKAAPVAVPVSAPAQPAPDPEAETRAYEAALNLFKANDHAGAVAAFNAFMGKYPDSPLAGNACYWLGLTYFAMGDHQAAVATQQRLLRDYPQHAKVPDAMVNMARAQIQLGETEGARQGLEQVVANYPATRSADLAKKILSLFK